jgi:hypothetical protein
MKLEEVEVVLKEVFQEAWKLFLTLGRHTEVMMGLSWKLCGDYPGIGPGSRIGGANCLKRRLRNLQSSGCLLFQ